MKKLFLLIGLTLGLTGWVAAENGNTWVSPQALQNYLYDNVPMPASDFFDLNTGYTVDNGDIAVTAAAQAYGIDVIWPFGESLADDASLNDLFFGYDNSDWVSVTRTGADSKVMSLR
ncbi:MAG: hypothetical protein K2L03_02445, partial [Bacteroidales bacterium]|nr:hypothetical protein [Bacteroidales bacterium]